MSQPSDQTLLWMFLAMSLMPGLAAAADQKYDPLKLPPGPSAKPLNVVVKDAARNREIPLRIYLPAEKAPAPVVLFSHGLGGSRENNPYLGNHWAARGYVAVFIQHPGSDDSVWKSKPLGERLAAMRQAADLQNFMLRVKDIPAVLDQLARWNKEDGNELKERMDLDHVGMCGHSFGAVTTQAVSGQHLPLTGTTLTDKRIKAAIAFSPSAPRNRDTKQEFGEVKIPWMLMTGTKDVAPIGDQDVNSRLAVFPALPTGDKYELVLNDAQHSAFGDRPLPGETLQRNPNHHRVILALSTAFWDAYLRNDAQAKAWLDGDGPRSVLEPADHWQKK
jgi:predicted dienelactone hydrolase